MNFLKPIDIGFILGFTLLFLYDFFPNIPFADALTDDYLIALIVGLFLFSLFFKRNRVTHFKEKLQWQLFSTAYIVFIIALFTILGGKSSIGVSFDNGVLWGVLLFSFFDMFFQWMKYKKLEQ
jgi:hypothetical protein